MKRNRLIIAAFVFFSIAGLGFAKEVERPDWVDNWRTIYPDTTYVAQLGKSTGKNNANEAKTVAANTVAQYIKTNVQSELNSTLKTHAGSNKKGRLEISTERDNSQTITLSVDTALTSLEFTDPWYNKKEKTWYCVAYVEREKIWEQYRPYLQNARDKLFSFYDIADNNEEPLYKMLIYMQSTEYEEEFFSAYSFARILSTTFTDTNYRSDLATVSSVSAKVMEEKNKCTFSINIKGDEKNIVYQCVKDELSGAGYVVRNAGEEALYSVNVNLHLDDTPMNSLHVIKASVELTVKGKTTSLFSYAKQTANVSGINEEIVKQKAANAVSQELHQSFMKEFNEKLNTGALENISL